MAGITNAERRALHEHINSKKWDQGTHFFRIKRMMSQAYLFDFLSDKAADSIIGVLAHELDKMYSSEEWYPVMGALYTALDEHPLAGVLLKSWRRHVADLVIEHYNLLAKELNDEHSGK